MMGRHDGCRSHCHSLHPLPHDPDDLRTAGAHNVRRRRCVAVVRSPSRTLPHAGNVALVARCWHFRGPTDCPALTNKDSGPTHNQRAVGTLSPVVHGRVMGLHARSHRATCLSFGGVSCLRRCRIAVGFVHAGDGVRLDLDVVMKIRDRFGVIAIYCGHAATPSIMASANSRTTRTIPTPMWRTSRRSRMARRTAHSAFEVDQSKHGPPGWLCAALGRG